MEVAIIVFFAAIFGGAVFLLLLIRLVFGKRSGRGVASEGSLAGAADDDYGNSDEQDEVHGPSSDYHYDSADGAQAAAQAGLISEPAGPAEQPGETAGDSGSSHDSGSSYDSGSGSDSGSSYDSGSDSGSGSSD